jgi:hypothetical protein
MSPDVEYNVTSEISLGDAEVAEFCRLKHPSVGKQCGFSGLSLAKNM